MELLAAQAKSARTKAALLVLADFACTASSSTLSVEYNRSRRSLSFRPLSDLVLIVTTCVTCCCRWLQMTAFAARLALDCQRVQGGYIDCIPCIQLSPEQLHSDSAVASDSSDTQPLAAPDVETMSSQTEIPTRQRSPTATSGPQSNPPGEPKGLGSPGASSSGGYSAANGHGSNGAVESKKAYGVSPALHSYMERLHAPLLAKPLVKLLVLAVFAGAAVLSLAAIPHVSRYAPAGHVRAATQHFVRVVQQCMACVEAVPRCQLSCCLTWCMYLHCQCF